MFGSRNGLTENDGHENGGPNLQGIKLQNLRPTALNTVAPNPIIRVVALNDNELLFCLRL